MDGPYSYEDAQAIAEHSVCGECGARLLNPWGGSFGVNGHVVRCFKDVDHQGVRPRGRETKRILNVEYDVMTQTPVAINQALALPDTQSGMAARVQEACKVGLLGSGKNNVSLTRQQMDNLATIALVYGLDPMMGDIMLFQGLPYVTIGGRRRIDDRAGNHPTYKMRPMDKDTKAAYIEMGAINEGDIVVVGEFTDPRYGNTIEATGRVLKSETQGSEHLPTVKWRLEMALKRCEARGRKMLYGPVALPGGAESRMRLVEEDDVVEGEIREMPDQFRPHLRLEPEPEPEEVRDDDDLIDPEETDTGEILGPDEANDPPESAPAYKDVLETAGGHGLDLEAFCEKVLAQASISEFERLGGTPAIAGRRLAAWAKAQG